MKIKRLNKIQILNEEFKIKWDKSYEGGEFSFDDHTIGIGLQSVSEIGIFNILIHEISEVIHIILNTRYTDYGTMRDFKFFQTHKEFQVHTEILASVLAKFV